MWEDFGHQTQEAGAGWGGVGWNGEGRGGLGCLASAGKQAQLIPTRSLSETGLPLAVGTAPRTYLSTSVLQA